VLGENNEKLEKVLKDIYARINDEKVSVKINLIEVKNAYTQAQSVANLIAGQLKKRVSSRLVIRSMLSRLNSEREVKGIKIQIDGRLDGSEIAQKKKFVQGKMPLSTIDSNIDTGFAKVITTYGAIGIKVLVYKGKI
jgi:small subunit ribosomal protein S3